MSELSELFDRDPLSLTDQDLATIVAKMRENQAQYELGAKPAPAKPKRATKATADLLSELGMGPNPLDELGLK